MDYSLPPYSPMLIARATDLLSNQWYILKSPCFHSTSGVIRIASLQCNSEQLWLLPNFKSWHYLETALKQEPMVNKLSNLTRISRENVLNKQTASPWLNNAAAPERTLLGTCVKRSLGFFMAFISAKYLHQICLMSISTSSSYRDHSKFLYVKMAMQRKKGIHQRDLSVRAWWRKGLHSLPQWASQA